MRLKLIDDAWTELHRLWSIRISLAYGVFAGVAAVIGCFGDYFNPWFLVALAIFVNLALIPLTRLMKQADKPGAPNV